MPISFPGLGHQYDVLIVGAGISGSEAAIHCARSGLDTLLLTTSLDTVYTLLGDGVQLKPLPGTLMSELHATIADDQGYVDSWQMHRAVKYALEHTDGIHLLQSSVSALEVEASQVKGVATWEGVSRLAKCTALCVGSFLEARLTIGDLVEQAGRLSEMAYDDLYLDLCQHGFEFEPLALEASFDDLSYCVKAKAFKSSEFQETSYRLGRLEWLYGAGICVSGYLSFEEAAMQGVKLAKALIESLS